MAAMRGIRALQATVPSYRVADLLVPVPPRFRSHLGVAGQDWIQAGLNPAIVAIHTVNYTASMQLHCLFAHVDRSERVQCLRSAREIARIAAQIQNLDPSLLPNTVAVRSTLSTASDFRSFATVFHRSVGLALSVS
jgi:hypothetical protein